jgi:hypothetical protein
MLAEHPTNPLNLVGGSTFFPSTAIYFSSKIGFYTSFDGGCT